MRFVSVWLLIAGLIALANIAPSNGGENLMPQQSPLRTAAHQIDELRARRLKSKRPFLEFLDVPTLSCWLYQLPAGGHDGQSPHENDEVYYVVKGRATLLADGKRFEAKPGSVLFVKAHVEHRFIDIKEDLDVIVFFSAAPTAKSAPSAKP